MRIILETSFILASGVWWAETTGARQYAALVGPRIIDDVNPVSGGSNVTHTTGTVKLLGIHFRQFWNK